MANPFANKLPVDINELPSRQQAIKIIAKLIVEKQGVSILSEPRMASSSLVKYLLAQDNRDTLYALGSEKLILGSINSQLLSAPFDELSFWKLVWESFKDFNKLEKHPIESLLNFSTPSSFYEIDHVLQQIRKNGYQLVVLLSEFDHLATGLGDIGNFCSNLRGLIMDDKLTLVVSCYQNPSTYNYLDFKASKTTHDLLMVLRQIRVGVLSNREVSIILNHNDVAFSNAERAFIVSVAGGHPYLIKIASSILWSELFRNKDKTWYLEVGKQIYTETQLHFDQIWHLWTPAKRKAITAVALIQTPYILKNHNFIPDDFVKEIHKFSPEIEELESFGYLERDEKVPGGYKLTQGAMLWWLADELSKTLRDEQTFQEWILDKELVKGVFRKNELEQLQKMGKFIGNLISEGSLSLIKAYTESLIK